jgi:uncharacterized protein
VRRKEKEISDLKEMEEIIAQTEICHVGLSDNNIPYIVPVNFGYKDKCIYFHCAREGWKLDIIRANRIVCVEFDSGHQMKISDTACEWGFKYNSVIGFGRANIIDDPNAKKEGLDIIMGHYSELSYQYKDEKIAGILIVKIEIDRLTGKKSN